jgi:hypothetical protein
MTIQEADILLSKEDRKKLAALLNCDIRSIYRVTRGDMKHSDKIAYVIEYAKVKQEKIRKEIKSII